MNTAPTAVIADDEDLPRAELRRMLAQVQRDDEKSTRVVTATDEAHVRKPLKELAEGLDPEVFWQVHRGVIVRASAIARAQRDDMGRITLHLRQHADTLSVSQAYAWRFKPM